METIQILLGIILALLLSSPVILYLFFKHIKGSTANAEKLHILVEQLVDDNKSANISKFEVLSQLSEKMKQIDETLLNTVDKSVQTLDQNMGGKVEKSIEVMESNNRAIIEVLKQLVDLNQMVHKTLLEVVDLEKELSIK